MSDKKTRDTDKIKFFEVGSEGAIRPVFPHSPEPESIEVEVRVNSTKSVIVDQLEQLKPQVEHIAQGARAVTQEEAEVLTRYIALREAEVEDLKGQQRQYKDYFNRVSQELSVLHEKNRELDRELASRKRSEENAQLDLVRLREEMEGNLSRLKGEYEEKMRAQEHLERELMELDRQKNDWKLRVAEDLKRIRLKERELETRHELLKRDSQALLDSKDRHLVELKRKCDALELEMESFEERLRSQSHALDNVEARKKRLIETLRLAQTLIEGMDRPDSK